LRAIKPSLPQTNKFKASAFSQYSLTLFSNPADNYRLFVGNFRLSKRQFILLRA
jgi:hypothetical protein